MLRLLPILCLITLPVQAQNLKEEVGVRISWSANDSTEGVERYEVSWFDGDRQGWAKLDDVSHQDDQRLSYVTPLVWIKSTLRAGDELCFQVTAIKGAERSAPTDRACDLIPDRFAVTTVPDVRITEISTPGQIEIQWLDQ